MPFLSVRRDLSRFGRGPLEASTAKPSCPTAGVRSFTEGKGCLLERESRLPEEKGSPLEDAYRLYEYMSRLFEEMSRLFEEMSRFFEEMSRFFE